MQPAFFFLFSRNAKFMRRSVSAAAVLFSLIYLLGVRAPNAAAFADNKIINPGFESPIGGASNWDQTANRGITNPVIAGAPEGARVLRLDETAIANPEDFTFTFQTVEEAKGGDLVTFSAQAREVVVDGDDDGQIRIEFQTEDGTLISAIDTSITSATFSRVTATGTAPEGTGQVTFVLRIQGASDGDAVVSSIVDFDNVIASIGSNPLSLQASPSSTSGRPGQTKMVVLRVRNLTGIQRNGLEVVAEPPPGIQIRNTDGAIDGRSVSSREGSVIFNLGNLGVNQESVFTFPMVLTSGIVPGKSYDLRLFARDSAGLVSETVIVLIRAELDPLFDEGTIIGKVFNDENQNTVQDKGEAGVPWVRLMTEEGIVVITDEHGRYHIPGVKPGRHVVKVDGHTLPEGTAFVSEESFLVKTTPGIMNKANFAVLVPPDQMPDQFKKELMVSITQGLDTSQPVLAVTMDPTVVKTGVGVLERQPVFHFHTNYPEYVKSWYLEIRDEIGREVWTGYGISTPPAEVLWNGQTEQGILVKQGLYSFQFKVADKNGNQDWTPLQFFRVVAKTDPRWDDIAQIEIPPVGDFNLFRDGKRSIPLVAKPTVRIHGKTRPENRVTINGRPVDVDFDGLFQAEMYVTPGSKEMVVEAANKNGEITSVRKTIKVKDSTFFMVALAEEQMGVNFQDGNVETVAQDDLFKQGFYEDGRLSYYLRGKLKGKFLVKSHYDTDDKRSALFTNLDPDDYYPIYGDGSSRDYEAQDTLDRFYMVVEMDRSFAKWGSFETAFTDTELGYYNRTLSGFKGHFETVGTTAYGDAKRGVKVFSSDARHRADHDIFAATGGSLYYLRNRSVIQGSEKLRVEVRDKIQDMVVHSRDLNEGTDYEIDYAEGRIMLSRPLSSVAAADTLVSNDILDGNPVYLVVDYEYDAGANAFVDKNRGLRGFTHMGNHVRIGTTLVEEGRQNGDYDLRALDAQIKLGRNTKITAEYAESKLQQTKEHLSYNGGLSFAEGRQTFAENTRPRENAYLIKAESKPIKNLETSGYLQGIEPVFSTARTGFEEGTKKYGFNAKYQFHETFYARYRYDNNEIADVLKPFSANNIAAPYENYQTHTFQTVYDDSRWLAEAEYRTQDLNLPPVSNLLPTLLNEFSPRDVIAGKLGYHFNDKLLPYAKVQVSVRGEPNHQFGGGVRYEIMNNLFAYMEEMIGHSGDSTYFGFERLHNNGMRSYANIASIDRGIGKKSLSTTVGNAFALTERSRVFSERQHSTYNSVDGFSDILGYEGKPGDRWDLQAKFERRHLYDDKSQLLDFAAENDLARNNTGNVISGAVGYADEKQLRARTSLEFRFDQDSPELRQWVTRNSLEYKLNQDLSYLGKIDYGRSAFLDPDDIPADFMEFSTGFAYRPVENDRLNLLTRYSYLRDFGSDFQFGSDLFGGVELNEIAHILSLDVAYELNRWIGIVEKLAYKNSILKSNVANEVILHNYLWVSRVNYHVTRKWDLALEYRGLWQFDAAKTLKHGPLVEVDREFYEYVRVGAGYNFTDFDDDIRSTSNYDSHGPFVRLTGKF